MSKPLKFTIEQVKSMIDKYFANTPEVKQTVTGLALLFGSKQLLSDYEKREGYSEMIHEAKLKIENLYEQCLRDKNPTGAIFALKNFGWVDKQVTENKTDITLTDIDYSKLSDETLKELAAARRT